jgi:hypothetical protein
MKCDKMHQKLICAKKAARKEAHVGAGGFATATSVSDLVSKAEQLHESEQTSSKVAKAQNKLDSYREKNKMLHESSKYTTKAPAVLFHGARARNQATRTSTTKSKRKKRQPQSLSIPQWTNLKSFSRNF